MTPAFLPPELTADRRPRLLVVDDEPLNVQALYQVFAADCQVLVATDGPGALQRCLQAQPDLVLLDISMAGMDGFEVCRRLQADPQTRAIPVIFVTAHEDEASEAQGLACGAVDFIVKPIRPATVRARVRTHLMLKLQGDLLRQMAFVDGLTSVHNRRYFDERLEAEWGRALRNRQPLSLLMVDVDHFKAYNDLMGHLAGDSRLRLVAEVLRRCIRRTSDVVARYGGEEFACVLPDSEPEAVMLLARMLIERVREATSLDDPSHPTTISIGVACKPARHDGRLGDWHELLSLADRALYQAKAAGRDTLCGHVLGRSEPLPVPPLSLAAPPDDPTPSVP